MAMNVAALLATRLGAIMVSILLGLGLATIFRRVCKGEGCRVVKAPKASQIDGRTYRIDHDCFRYVPFDVPCQAVAPLTSEEV